MDGQLHSERVLSGQRYVALIGGTPVEVEADFTRDGRVWLCRDSRGQFFPVNTADLRPLAPCAECTSEVAGQPLLRQSVDPEAAS